MEGSTAPSHDLRSLPIEIQSHLCLGACSPWKSPEEQAGGEDLGVQEVEKGASLLELTWSPRGTPSVPAGLRLSIPAMGSSTLCHPLLREQRPGNAQPLVHPLVLLRASLPHHPKLWVAGEGLAGPTVVAWAGSRDTVR